ncbi:MAG: tetratricopeptide repeat protein [Planctomycetia bacterium]
MPGKVTEDHSTAADARDASQPATRRRRPERLFAAADAPDDPDVRRLHTTSMLADLLGVPPVAVRHWIRTGLLVPTRRSGTLDWFDFGQLVAGRSLARLLAAGLSLREIDAKLTALAPAGAAEVARAGTVVADGRRLSVRRGDRLLGAGGQMQLAFYAEGLADVAGRVAAEPAEPVVDMAAHRWVEIEVEPAARPDRAAAADVGEILDLADDLEAAGEFGEAAEAGRAVLQAQGPTAPVAFMLAELLYRAGDLTAARERYYATIELDPDHVQARTSLACVLAELGDHELALAALEGVLRQEPAYADAHWHVAGVLADVGRDTEARHHLETFLELAPDSPWAEVARARLAAVTAAT